MKVFQQTDIIGFAEQACIFSNNYLRYCLYLRQFENCQHIFPKKLYSDMIGASQLLEDFLDYHGAKNNKDWYFYRELSAAVRHLSLACYSQKHIINRIPSYNLQDSENFRTEGESTLCFLTGCLIKMATVILDEANRLGIPIPLTGYDDSDFHAIRTGESLPSDIDAESKEEQEKNIVKLATDFLEIARHFDQLVFYELYDMEKILSLVPEKVNEVEIRQYEMLVHNLQSYFDTYVVHGGNGRNKKLISFRGIFSVVFHLLKVIGRLLHFYERHLHDAGYKDIYQKVHDRLSVLINSEILLEKTINYGLYYVCYYLSNSKDLAREILNENIERGSITVPVPVQRGFHCRPSLLVSKIVQHYGGQVELWVNEDRFDAASVLELQWAGGKIQKENYTHVVFKGDVRALKDIEIIASYNYCEDIMGKGLPIPNELSYLK